MEERPERYKVVVGFGNEERRPQLKDCGCPLEPEKGKHRFPLEHQENNAALPTLDFSSMRSILDILPIEL